MDSKLKRLGVVFLSLGVLALTIPSTSATESGKKNPIPPDGASLETGKRLYVSNCGECHGHSGKGDGKRAHDLGKDVPDLTAGRIADASDGQLFQWISRGKRPMPAFEKELSEQDRWHVINYIRSLSGKQ